MNKFKIIIPAGYNIENFKDDNIDINVIFENGEIFFATLFQVDNIKKLMSQNEESYFFSDSMLILKDLKKETIKKSIEELIADSYFNNIFSKIGNLHSTKGYQLSFNNIQEFTNGKYPGPQRVP